MEVSGPSGTIGETLPASNEVSSKEVSSDKGDGEMSESPSHNSSKPDLETGHALKHENNEVIAPDNEFMVDWDGDHDPLNPRSMSSLRKWIITVTVSLGSFCVTSNSSIYTLIYTQIMPEFRVSEEVATLGLTTFVIGLALGPLFLAPLSEFYGRRPVYLWSFFLFFIWIIPLAVAQNIATILVARFFDGVFASAFLSVAGGTIGDLFTKSKLGLPMTIYTGSPFLGPALGPVIGGFINQYANWRWTFWVLLIWAGVQGILIAILIPETYHPVLLRRKAIKLRENTGNQKWKAQIEIMDKSILKTVLWSCTRPFEMLIFEPMLLNLCLLSALLLGILYLFFGAFPVVFERNHGFTLSQTGLSFLGLFVGMVSAMTMAPLWRRNYVRIQNKYESVTGEAGVTEPEFRLPPTIFGAIIVPIGLFGFAWTTYPSVHWIVPIIFSGLFGIGIISCFSGIFTFTVEAYPLYAASALGANSFTRGVFAAAFPLFGVQMYEKLGDQWASSLLAFLALVMAPFPFIFYVYGKRIRQRSRFT